MNARLFSRVSKDAESFQQYGRTFCVWKEDGWVVASLDLRSMPKARSMLGYGRTREEAVDNLIDMGRMFRPRYEWATGANDNVPTHLSDCDCQPCWFARVMEPK
jgi:hypothetical protein